MQAHPRMSTLLCVFTGLHSRKNDHAVVGIKGTMKEASRVGVGEPEEHENEIEITHAQGRGYSAWAQPLHLAGFPGVNRPK